MHVRNKYSDFFYPKDFFTLAIYTLLDSLWQQKPTHTKIIILLIFPKILLNRKYPEISCVEEREKYKAVFNDQFQEYKDLHRDISATLDKFRELDATMARLLRDGKTQEVRWMFNKLSTDHLNHFCDQYPGFNLRWKDYNGYLNVQTYLYLHDATCNECFMFCENSVVIILSIS